MQSKYDVGLVLEGGGMRGIFTAGFLDCLIDYGVRFPYVIGVSAGTTTGLSYLSEQKGRTRFSDTDLLKMYNYVGLRHFIAGHGIINLDYLFYEYPDRHFPFDFEAYRKSGVRFVMVATDAKTGEATYFEERDDFERFLSMSKASCSMPFLCPQTVVDGRKYIDGGVADSLPFERALQDGCEKVVVVMTKPIGFRRKEKSEAFARFLSPVMQKLLQRNRIYNAQMDRLATLEREGRAIVIRPSSDFGVGRTTNDTKKIEKLYDEGYKCGQRYVSTKGL